ncbi:MAG: glycosyl hydrolase family 28 protein [Polyangiales bacterium]
MRHDIGLLAAVGLLALVGCDGAPTPADATAEANSDDVTEKDAAPDATSTADVTAEATSDAPSEASADGATDGGAPGPHVLREDFNAMPADAAPAGRWTSTPGVTVRAFPFADDHSVEVTRPTGAMTASLATSLPGLRGRVAFEAKVMAREAAGFKAIPYVYDRAGTAVASVAFLDGDLVAWVGATRTVVQPFAPGVWYLVRVVVDTAAGTFDLFVDGVRKLQGRPLRNAADALDRVQYYVDGAGDGLLRVDNVRVYREADLIGAPPAPVFDARRFGAAGDGARDDTAALQRAVDAAAGTGGSVLLSGGVFLSGTLTLRSRMTLFIDPSATLRGTTSVAAYPAQSPATGNTQLGNCRRALLYAHEAADLRVDGGGTVDGQGGAFTGAERERPMLLWAVRSSGVTVQNVYFQRGAVWGVVAMESDGVVFRNLNVQSSGITHDGIDVVDGSDVTVEDCAVRSGDDAMCLKSGVRRGLTGVAVRRSFFSGDNGGSNGVKFGTASYGAFRDVTVEDVYVKDVQYAAMAVESRQGADVARVAFRRVEFANAGSAFFVYLAQQDETHPDGDVPRLGSMAGVSFTDVLGRTASWPNSPHQAALVTGHVFRGVTYRVTDLAFTRVAVSFAGGRASVPGDPPEATPNQYPESNMFGDLPAWGYFLRHVDGVRFEGSRASVAAPDARPRLATRDVSGLVER